MPIEFVHKRATATIYILYSLPMLANVESAVVVLSPSLRRDMSPYTNHFDSASMTLATAVT
jgi:hypothetical protein